MPSVAVGDVLEDERAVTGTRVVFAVLYGGFDREDVHAVDFESGDILAAFVVVCQGGGAVGGGAHAVFVVCGGEEDQCLVRTIRLFNQTYFRSQRG